MTLSDALWDTILVLLVLNHDLLFSVPCCFLLDRLIKEATCNVMVDHLQSRVTPWRQYASHVKVRGTLSKMETECGSPAYIFDKGKIKKRNRQKFKIFFCTVPSPLF